MDMKLKDWLCIDADETDLSSIEKGGVYIFVVKEEFKLNIKRFNSEVTGIFGIDGKRYPVTVGVPPCNRKGKEIKINANDMFYVGSADNLRNRISSHLNACKVNNAVSLKLGFKRRSYVKKYLKIYYNKCNKAQRRKIEKQIRMENDVIFGE